MIRLYKDKDGSIWLHTPNNYVCVKDGTTAQVGNLSFSSKRLTPITGTIDVKIREPKNGDVYRRIQSGEFYVVAVGYVLRSLEAYDIGQPWCSDSLFNDDEHGFEYVGTYKTFELGEKT